MDYSLPASAERLKHGNLHYMKNTTTIIDHFCIFYGKEVNKLTSEANAGSFFICRWHLSVSIIFPLNEGSLQTSSSPTTRMQIMIYFPMLFWKMIAWWYQLTMPLASMYICIILRDTTAVISNLWCYRCTLKACMRLIIILTKLSELPINSNSSGGLEN